MPDLESVRKLEQEIFTPALQKAAQKAKDDGYTKDSALMAAANAYLNMLIPLLGNKEKALEFLKQQVSFLEKEI